MSMTTEVFGYLFVGASPSEFERVRKFILFNREVLDSAANISEFWNRNDFRFSPETEDIRELQIVSVVRIYFRTSLGEFEIAMQDIFKKLAWSNAFLVNRSIDRTLVDEPISVEYEMENPNFCLSKVSPVGESFTLRRTIRKE